MCLDGGIEAYCGPKLKGCCGVHEVHGLVDGEAASSSGAFGFPIKDPKSRVCIRLPSEWPSIAVDHVLHIIHSMTHTASRPVAGLGSGAIQPLMSQSLQFSEVSWVMSAQA